MQQAISKINTVLVEKLGLEEQQLKPEASFDNDLGVDSLDVWELFQELERTFNIDIPDEDAEKLTTLGAVYSYVQESCEN
ncbi:acyl carrier protein [Deminuibacter soli]|uniref:Acyl carrier protein n=1 Tax=Deminuibacter soli TaxID=2291815 RepID=A0A3E1NJ45_9BACT|nr:acyl carrier protein [Deminuibacter soli]RFM27953.1 acyl carrier protein [Deminuibacter soli]